MKKFATIAASAALAVTGIGAASAPAQAAPLVFFCWTYQSDTSSCTTDTVRFDQHHPDRVALVSVYDYANKTGNRAIYFGPKPCTVGTDNLDYIASFPTQLDGKVSYVEKHAASRCDFTLVGPAGNRSPRYESSQNLAVVANGAWNNRAVRLRLT